MKNLFLMIYAVIGITLDTSQANGLEYAIDQQTFTFGRFVDSADHEAMQMPIVRYAYANGRPGHVDLIGAVHVGDAAYYAELNERFKNYDVVLFEMVMPENSEIPKNQKLGQQSPVSMLHNTLKSILGLTFQLDEVDYSASNFVHADMTPKEMDQSMANKGESWLSMIIKLWRAGLVQQLTGKSHMSDGDLLMALLSGDTRTHLKRMMAKELMNMDETLLAIEGQEGSTLITERNKKALEVLEREQMNPANQKIAIFYGAGHLKDMGQRLIDQFAMVPISVEWVDAWRIK